MFVSTHLPSYERGMVVGGDEASDVATNNRYQVRGIGIRDGELYGVREPCDRELRRGPRAHAFHRSPSHHGCQRGPCALVKRKCECITMMDSTIKFFDVATIIYRQK